MMTAMCVAAVGVVGLSTLFMVCQLFRGSPIAVVWWFCGGLETAVDLLGELLKGIAEG